MYKELENMLLASFLKEQIRLQLILSWYTFDKIYNINKTGFYYRMSSNQTLSTKPVYNKKKDKIRITVLLGINVIETNKLKL
jgi:hypothetical protein